MLRLKSPVPIPVRLRDAVLATVALFGLYQAYRFFWNDISTPYPGRSWTTAEYGGSWSIEAKAEPGWKPWSLAPLKDGNPGRLRVAEEYMESILSTQDGRHPKMTCSPFNKTRYDTLAPSTRDGSPRRKYFFALDLRQIVDLLPTLMGSILEAIRFLGPELCALSIVEGFSTDGTFEVLKLLQREMDKLGVPLYLQTSDINPRHGDRIGKLAKLRNLALEPMMADAAKWDHDATIVFINDVAACTDDILELVYQKDFQGADMTCAMDYHMLNGRVAFYDVWVSRSMDGDSFFEVPGRNDWHNAWNLFPNDKTSRSRFEDRKPFQVFSCWNGATAFTATPFLDGQLQFRRAAEHKGECGAGEPTLLCKDMWSMGYNKILVVPSISLGYDIGEGGKIKESEGHTSSWTGVEETSRLSNKIDWNPNPPDMVRCIPDWGNQFWKPWDHASSVPPGARKGGR